MKSMKEQNVDNILLLLFYEIKIHDKVENR